MPPDKEVAQSLDRATTTAAAKQPNTEKSSTPMALTPSQLRARKFITPDLCRRLAAHGWRDAAMTLWTWRGGQ
jgi:hypothetical protein